MPLFDMVEEEPEEERPEEGLDTDETSTQEEPEPQDAVRSLEERIKQLESKIGTDDDVRAVKRTRDQYKNTLEQLTQQLVPQVQQLATEVQSTKSDPQFETWKGEWRNYINAQTDPQTRNKAEQDYRRELEYAERARTVADRERQLEEASAQTTQQQTQAYFQNLQAKVVGSYVEAAQKAGIPETELDMSSFSALTTSFGEKVAAKMAQPATKLRPIPTKPQRGGQAAGPQNIAQWFDNKIAAGKWSDINAAFEAPKVVRGLKIEDILRR